MQINFSDYDLSEFIVKEDLFCGIPAKLIIPNHIGTKFNQKNKIFRSSIWDLNGKLLSASYPKFVNMFENPDNFPFYDDGEHIFVDKIDGSTGIFDWINFQLSIRNAHCITEFAIIYFLSGPCIMASICSGSSGRRIRI